MIFYMTIKQQLYTIYGDLLIRLIHIDVKIGAFILKMTLKVDFSE